MSTHIAQSAPSELYKVLILTNRAMMEWQTHWRFGFVQRDCFHNNPICRRIGSDTDDVVYVGVMSSQDHMCAECEEWDACIQAWTHEATEDVPDLPNDVAAVAAAGAQDDADDGAIMTQREYLCVAWPSVLPLPQGWSILETSCGVSLLCACA